MIALSVAAALAIFVVYTALAGNGVFVAKKNSLITKCPRHYAGAKSPKT